MSQVLSVHRWRGGEDCPQNTLVCRINRSRKNVHVEIHLSDQGVHIMSVLWHLFPMTKNVLHPLMINSPHLKSMWIFRFSSRLSYMAGASALKPSWCWRRLLCVPGERSSGQACTCAPGEMEPAWKVKRGQVEVMLNIPSSPSLKSSVFFVKLSCYSFSLGNASPVLLSAVPSIRCCVCSQSRAWPVGLFCSLVVTSLYLTLMKLCPPGWTNARVIWATLGLLSAADLR